MLFVAAAAWLVGVVVSYTNGNRVFPTSILLLGIGLIVAAFYGLRAQFSLAGVALLAAIIWVANKADDMR